MGAIPKPEACPHGDCRGRDVQLERGEVPVVGVDPDKRLAHRRDFVTAWVWVCGSCGRRLGLAPDDQGPPDLGR